MSKKTNAMFNTFRQHWGHHSPSHGRPVEHKVLGEGGRKTHKNQNTCWFWHLFFLIKFVFIRARHFLVRGGSKKLHIFWLFFLRTTFFRLKFAEWGRFAISFWSLFGCWTSHKTGEQIGRAVWAVVLATHQMHVGFHKQRNLGGGFEDFLFSPLLGEMIQFD